MCDHGRLNYAHVNAPDRLRVPLVRRNGTLAPCDWDEALAETARQLRHAAHSTAGREIGAIASPHLSNEELFRFAQMLRALSVTNVDVAVPLGQSDKLLIKAEKAANARGARDMGLQPPAHGLDLSGILAAAAAGQITVLYVCGSDLSTLADQGLLERALSQLRCLIVQDIAPSPLTDRAHVVLPSLTFAEKAGTMTNHAGRVQQLHRAITPPEEQLGDGEIFSRLLNLVSEGRCTFEPAAVLEEIAAAIPAYQGISLAGVGALGWQLPNPDETAGRGDAETGGAPA